MLKFIGRLTHLHLLLDVLYQKFFTIGRLLNMILFYLFPQSCQNLFRGIYTDIAHNQNFFQFFIEFFIDMGKTAENRIDSMYNIISCFGQPFF